MKSFILKAGVFTSLLFLGLSHEQASAEMNFPSKCTSYGEIKPNQNPSPQQMNCLLTNAALEANIPPEVVKAVAAKESDWRQFVDGQPLMNNTGDGGIGIMQITNQPGYDQEKLKDDIYFNIQAGVDILNNMFNRMYSNGQDPLPRIKGADQYVIENWYFPVMAYNGTKPINSPIHQADGTRNTQTYQDDVFGIIQNDSYLLDPKIYPSIFAQFPFSSADFTYDSSSTKPIQFNQLEYTVTDPMHASAYFFKTGDKVVVTTDDVKLRSQPSTSASINSHLSKNTTLIIDGEFTYDRYIDSNRFVWYPVKTADQKLTGYISSAYIIKKLDAPVVSPVDDNDVSLSGKAPFANVMIQIMNGTLPVGSTVADATGDFKAEIPAQKAGTNLTVTYKDKLNELSPATTISVTPPLPAKGYIDNPANGSILKGASDVNGWFLDGSDVAMIEVLVDGKSMGTAQYGSARTDVENAFPQYQNANSGYQYTLDTTKITNGQHSLTVRETGNNGNTTVLSQMVNVQNLPAKGSIDNPAINSSISGSSNVQGWFLDGSGVAKIEVLIDGISIGTAQYGSTRIDVQKAFPQYQNANSGYQYTLDTKKITNGQHSLTVREIGNNGITTVLSQMVKVQNLPAKGSIDTPAINSPISETSNVQGWFLDGSGVAKIEVLIDGISIGTAQYGSTRIDVQKAFPQYQNANSGYQYTFDTTKITNGQHLLSVRETGNNGTTTVLNSQMVNVQNLLAKGSIDAPAINSAISGSTNVKGWFLDRSGVAKIEILVDGTSMGTAQYGGPRPDVQKAFPQYQNANSGYQYTLDTKKITNGQHSLTVRETGNNGTTTVLKSQMVNVQN
ncbi:Ig-like domain-containing protein [Neobacillus ginsengisoli]|uniref:FlaG/FlaF family flagellin (Archaellin) n=1 Tax=Neobacillus ginsengisoli TaxID=904295 RepID=A0ABT9XT05_9BACI|nr:Ig-like domain-containing protein [Neobacillus ginsengisoli]MDQ0198683.1 FlaG/FlaF family flagellin (archaellin) [Neobacillus ginsengisoli]